MLWKPIMTLENFKHQSIIYFLYKWSDIVYIWESWKWIIRPLSHNDKDYDKIEIYDWPENIENRKILEEKLIKKYTPIYNKDKSSRTVYKSEWYIQVENYRRLLKSKNRRDITCILWNFIKKYCEYKYDWWTMWVLIKDIEKQLFIRKWIIL